MKIDMHCHIKEGSVDSKVSLDQYITKLKENGFDGMVITDHDTYKGYRYWKHNMKGKMHEDFVVLKGIEYDTRDAGHFLIIMPELVKMRLLELRGLPLSVLIDFVHHHGGIIGPAHPCGEKYLSYTNTKRFYKSPELAKRFDFIEVFNSCEPEESNAEALKLAQKYNKIGTGGSDAHKLDCVSTGYTDFPEPITCETDLISQIRQKAPIKVGGTLYTKTTKDKIGKANKVLVYSFWFYNKAGELLKRKRRKDKLSTEQPLDPIDPIEIPYLHSIKRLTYKKSNS
ncbi:MAG: PHP domain-containing protein [Lachnospiraceae bacterium]